jgi:hypothetical protein
VNGVNNPCPCGFRVPTWTEFKIERYSWSSMDAAGAFNSPLKLPLAGWREFSIGMLMQSGAVGVYWSSDGNILSGIHIIDNSGIIVTLAERARGYSVRCIKD